MIGWFRPSAVPACDCRRSQGPRTLPHRRGRSPVRPSCCPTPGPVRQDGGPPSGSILRRPPSMALDSMAVPIGRHCCSPRLSPLPKRVPQGSGSLPRRRLCKRRGPSAPTIAPRNCLPTQSRCHQVESRSSGSSQPQRRHRCRDLRAPGTVRLRCCPTPGRAHRRGQRHCGFRRQLPPSSCEGSQGYPLGCPRSDPTREPGLGRRWPASKAEPPPQWRVHLSRRWRNRATAVRGVRWGDAGCRNPSSMEGSTGWPACNRQRRPEPHPARQLAPSRSTRR